MFLGPARHLHVEAGVVDQDQHVGGERRDVGLAFAHLTSDGAEVAEHLHDPEERGLAVVFPQVVPSARFGHPVAAPEAEPGFGVGFLQPFDQVGPVQVARGFAGYEVIFHVEVKS